MALYDMNEFWVEVFLAITFFFHSGLDIVYRIASPFMTVHEELHRPLEDWVGPVDVAVVKVQVPVPVRRSINGRRHRREEQQRSEEKDKK